MSNVTAHVRSKFPACKSIVCILPDDGTDKRLLVKLRKEHGVIRANSAHRRGIGALSTAKTKRGKLPSSELVKQVNVLCSVEQADAIFELIFWTANIDKPGGGMIWQHAVSNGTPYDLPGDVPDEAANT